MAENRKASLIWRTDMLFTGISQNGYTVPIDAAPQFGGHEAGIRAMDLMLISLASCSSLDVISILRKKRQEITGFEVEVEGARREEHPKTYTEIWVRFTVKGPNVDPAAVERAIELSRDKYCAAAATLRHTATLHYDFSIVAEHPEEPMAQGAS